MNQIVIFTIFALCTASSINAEDWNYDDTSGHGPKDWPKTYPNCSATSQSPIDIRVASARSESKYGRVQNIDYDKTPQQQFKLTNNGHTVLLTTNTNNFRVKDGALPDEYVLEQLHFHWGENDSIGSEHEINGRSYPLEVHFVHRKSKYTSVTAALADPEGVAVLGVFGEVTTKAEEVNDTLKHLVEQLAKVDYNGNATDIAAFALQGLLPQSPNYYRYKGSLTTPPCTESVIWTVFAQPIKIMSDQLKEFRKLHETEIDELVHNYRPLQQVNGRTVYIGVASRLVLCDITALLSFVVTVCSLINAQWS